MVTNILSRLDVRTIASSKCVCKPWLHLLETDEFVNSHLAKSVPSLAIMNVKGPFKFCQVLNLKTSNSMTLRPIIFSTECFSSFGAPAFHGESYVLNNCLCFCECEDGIVVWLMKEYGVEKSWSKDYVIAQSAVNDGYGYNDVFPIKVFKNGDLLLMLLDDMCLRYYSNKTKAFQDYGIVDEQRHLIFFSSMLFTPSVQTLKGLGMENVISF